MNYNTVSIIKILQRPKDPPLSFKSKSSWLDVEDYNPYDDFWGKSKCLSNQTLAEA